MTGVRTAGRALLVGTAAVLFTVPAVIPAAAHGAPVSPISRVAACSSVGGADLNSAACRAAVAQHGGQPFEDWDNLRVAGVAGRDRQVIPDGKLCSGGIAEYRGLDLPRADWPATRLTSGARFTLTYRTTIPHQGSFELYLTTAAYTATQPLTWSKVATKPFLTVTDPPVTDGAYRISGRLPSGRTGRQILYTVWRNTSTSDTYYSCSDVVLARPAAARPASTAPAAPARTTAAATRAPSTPAARSSGPAASAAASRSRPGGSTPATAIASVQPVSASGKDDAARLLAAALGATVLGGGALAAFTLRRRRRS